MTMKVRALLAVMVVLGATMWLAGCSNGPYVCHAGKGDTTCSSGSGGGTKAQGGGGGVTGDAFLFVADAGNIQGMTLNASAGTIQDTSGFQPPTTPNVTNYWLVIAQGKYLYVGFPGLGQIFGYTIGSDGSLTALSGSPFNISFWVGSTVPGAQGMIANPAGTMMFILGQSGKQVYVYQIGSDGGLTQAGAPTTLAVLPENLATDGLGKYLYVSSVGTVTSIQPQIAAYSIGSSGTLTAVPNSPFISNGLDLNFAVNQMQGESSGKYMIGTTSSINNADAHLYVLAIQPDGELVPVSGSPFTTVYSPSFVTVQPNSGGTLVYSTTVNGMEVGGLVEGFQLNASTGALTEIPGSPFTVTGDYAQFDQAGTFLFVRDLYSKQMNIFNVTSSSVLTQPTASVGWGPGSWAPTDIP